MSAAPQDRDLLSEGPSGPLAIAAAVFAAAAMGLFFSEGLAGGVTAEKPPNLWAVNFSFCAMILAVLTIYRVRKLTGQAVVRTAAIIALLAGLAGPLVYFAQGMHWRNSIEGRELRNLARIAQASRDYARAHDGAFPGGLADLLGPHATPARLSAGDLCSPFRGPPELRIPLNGSNADVEREIAAHCDYVYLGTGVRGARRPDGSWELSPKLIIAASKTAKGAAFDKRLHDQISVAFASGDAKYIPAAKFEAVLQASNEERRKLKLPPLDEFGRAR